MRPLTDLQKLRALAFAAQRAAGGARVSLLGDIDENERWRELAFELARAEKGRVCVQVPRADASPATILTFEPAGERMDSPARVFTELLVDCRRGDLASARHLVEAGAPINAANSDGLTALHAAARGGHLPIVQLLLKKGADPEHADAKGGTPLMRACRHGHAHIAAALLDSGAMLDRTSRDGYTALMLAARGGHDDVVRLLCEQGADVRIRALRGATALSLAIEGGHETTKAILRAHGAEGAGPAQRHAEFAHEWWYGPLVKGTRVAEPVASARPVRPLPPPTDAGRFAQRRIDSATRAERLPHDGGRWRTRAVSDVVASETAGARLSGARHKAIAFEHARAMREELDDALADRAGLPRPYRSRAAPLPRPVQHQPRVRLRREAPAW